jgi:hypothetical protein
MPRSCNLFFSNISSCSLTTQVCIMRLTNVMIIGWILAISGCSVFPPPVGVPCQISTLQPSVTLYDEFRSELVSQCHLYPQAITSPGKDMIYIVPREGDTLFWFTDNRLVKITKRNPDLPNAWTKPIRD